MARQNNGLTSGQIGPVVFNVPNGRGYAMAAAFKVRRTKATKQSAKLFGKSKRIGSFLRREIIALLPYLNNGQVHATV